MSILTSASSNLALDSDLRLLLWQRLATEIERYQRQVAGARVAPALDPGALRQALAAFDFQSPLPPPEALAFAVRGLWEQQVHTPHPRYFGLFNPAPTTMGIVADALVAAFNPQMAAWSHNPFATEVERHLVHALGARFGYPAASLDGVFCSGGAEANHTALLAALTHAFPEFARGGLRALPAPPTVYVSRLSHDSVLKAARLCGLGTDCVRVLEVDAAWRLAPAAVAAAVSRDRAAGARPAFLVATAGATATGVMDPLADLAALAQSENLWFHVDAAWGGFAALLPELRPAIAGIERADSITFDAHKSLSVPMGAGIFLTRHPHILSRTFGVAADYMPRDADEVASPPPDPFAHSMQWSRRFTGLKLFLSLAVAGWSGYEAALRHQVAMGDYLRQQAQAQGWRLANSTPLPLACLADEACDLEATARAVVASGEAWISAVRLPGGLSALRACITNYRTQPADVDALLASLARHRVVKR
ncbi:MAG TPA: aminotransferase class V-fold PLP-dependent enzyme [Terriglobales bacterium]|nr:aminotransferase class V-fold PLP-dependent enzyme [Terriglobales bacterium]